jgi:glycosyltransferase involved in cell wall biosynthesis
VRIALVEPDGAGGLTHYAHQLAEALQEQGADVTLITSRTYELDHLPRSFRLNKLLRLWPANQTVRPGPLARLVRRAWRAVRYTWEWERLTRELIRTRPDVVQFSVIRFSYLSFFLRRLRRRGLVLTQVCHEFELREARWAWLRSLDARMATAVYRNFAAIFFHGRAHRERFQALFGPHPAVTAIIPHGNEGLLAQAGHSGDLRDRYRIPDGRPVALFFGGLRPSKGVPDLIAAFADARCEVDATLLIAGRPSEGVVAEGFRAQAAELGIADSVIVDEGYVPLDEVAPLVRAASVVVLPYRSGTASGVIQTAYSVGRPVVVTDVGSLAEAVDHGTTGLVVPPDDRAALTRALVKMLEDPEAAGAMGAAAQRSAERHYGWGPVAAAVLRVTRSVS